MVQVNPKNERLKMRYAEELKVYQGRAESTIDPKLRAIKRFEEVTNFADLDSFDYDLALAFVEGLKKHPISIRTRLRTMRHVKGFFQYLAVEGLLKKKHAHKAVHALRLSERDRRAGQSRKPVKFHSVQAYKDAINAIPKTTAINRRNRAILTFLLLTAARDGAMVTMTLGLIDIAKREAIQDPDIVHTKGGKIIPTWFFPVGDEIIEELQDYIQFLRTELNFTDSDPLFPSNARCHDENDRFFYEGLTKRHWANADPVRGIFRTAFEAIGLKYVKPHTIRHTLTELAYELGLSPEEFKAWSQNYGHDDVSTTYNHYGPLSADRQRNVMLSLHKKTLKKQSAMPETREELVALVQEAMSLNIA